MRSLVITFTPEQLWTAVLALAAAIVAIEKAWGVVAKMVEKHKAPEQNQNTRITKLEDRMAQVEHQVTQMRSVSGTIDKLRDGNLAVLHDRIYQLCHEYLTRGSIKTDELSNLEYLYRAYHAEGGNGTGTELYNRAKSLEIKD